MNRIICVLLVLLLFNTSCNEDMTGKPPHLISRDKMVDILVDIHLSDAAFQTRRYSNTQLNAYTESDFYYSILKKHHLVDSVFEISLLYYSSKPKEFEKIYTRVINRLTVLEQDETKKTKSPVNLEKSE
jgi:hypothetical protein